MAKTAAARNTLDASAHSPELAALAAAFQHVAIGMAVVSPDGRMVDVNPALCQMLGYERDEVLGRDIAAIAAPDGCADVHSEWLRLAAGEIDGFLCETCFDHKAGSVVRGLVTVSVLRDDDGRRIGALAQVQDITAQKAAEAAAREREARLVALAGQLPVALYSLEPGADGAFHFVSPLFEHLTGLGPDELPKSFAELLARVHPDDRAAVLAADELAGRTGEPAQLQYRLRGGNDEWIWVENRSVPMRNERGTPRVWHGALLDISAQMRLKESLQESETRFRHAFEDAAIGMSLGNADHICLDANAAYCRIVGRPRAALIGRPFAEFTHPDDLEAYMRQVARLHAGEIDAYEIEKRYPRPDGTVVTGLLTVSAVRDDVGNFLYDIGQLQDITAQKEAEAALRENETRLRKLVEHLPAALYRQDAPADGSATYVSPNFATLLGLDPGDFPLGFSTFFERVHPEDRTAVTQAAAHAERTGEPMDVEYRLQRGDGEWTWIHDRSVLERDAAGQPRTWTGVLLDIGERKRLEASLRESEAHLRTIIEQAPAAVYRLEPGASGRFTYASPRFAALTGISLDRRNGSLEAYFARVHPDDVALLREKDAAAGRTGEPFDFEYRLRGQDSAWIWVHDRSTLERDEAGNPVAWHGVLLDVSERRTLESSLRESEARFRSIFEGAGIGMALSVPEGVMVLANPALETLLGYAPGELVGVRIADISEPEDFARQAGPQRLMRTGELDAFQFEKRFVRKDGGIVWGLLNATSVKDEQGVVTAVIGQVQDITARKEAEAALRASEARFRALVQNDPDVVVIVDDAMTIAYVSPSSLTAFGVPPDALLGPTKDNVHRVHAADLERGLALFGEVDGRPGAIASAEIRIKHRHHGWRWFQSTVANLLDDPGITGYLINLRDITDRKQAALASEAALKTQRAAIAELERLNQSKSRFLSTISHEFRTPLTAIIGYSEYLTANAYSPALVAEDAAVIHREASRLNRLVDDVLLVDRAGAGHLPLHAEPVDINALAEDVAATFRPMTGSHKLSLSLDPSLPPVDGDRDRLAQALTNLVSNAVKYSPAGGMVSIATHNDGEEVLVTVHDQGIGIAAADRARIFDRFERVERGIAGRIAGTGLGLSIAREIAGLHGGRLWVESEVGYGSTFFLALPKGDKVMG